MGIVFNTSLFLKLSISSVASSYTFQPPRINIMTVYPCQPMQLFLGYRFIRST